jgi:hypothetical protein
MSQRPGFSQRYGKWAIISGGAEGIGAAYKLLGFDFDF